MKYIRSQLGCWLAERWKTELVLCCPRLAELFGLNWTDLRNRHENVLVDQDSSGRICDWQNSSKLTVSRVFPKVGGRLLAHCLSQWPIVFHPLGQPLARAESPVVSFVVGFRGIERRGQFEMCLASIRGQTGIDCELIVVEQCGTSLVHELLPEDVVHIIQGEAAEGIPFNRSWALNVGARHARGEIVVSLDADMVVPSRFAEAIAGVMQRSNLDALRLARFVFYIDEPDSRRAWAEMSLAHVRSCSEIVANCRTPLAVRTATYLEIGGHDESFFGWGGEDDEFEDRLQVTRYAKGAFLPVIHIWHPHAPNRLSSLNTNHLASRLAMPPRERVELLCERGFGGDVPAFDWRAISEGSAD